MRIIQFFCLVATSLAAPAEKRIVNGSPSELFSHPYQASIQVPMYGRWKHNCGGVLIAKNIILTAAHCLEGRTASRMHVIVGALNLYEDPSDYKQSVGVSRSVIHESYRGNISDYANDIGIIYLASSVTLNKNVKIATLAPKGSSFANTQCVIAGWGLTSGFGRGSDTLLEADITKITNAECQSKWHDKNINSKQICVYEDDASSSGNRPSSCNGDSGGAMMCGDNKELLAGITSWGDEYCDVDLPSVYTRVSEYLDWIARVSEYLDWIARVSEYLDWIARVPEYLDWIASN